MLRLRLTSTAAGPFGHDRNAPPEAAPASGTGTPRLPRPGEPVAILARRGRARFEARAVAGRPDVLTVELAGGGVSLRRGATVELEWVDPLGLVRLRGRVAGAGARPLPVVEIALGQAPTLVQRRERVRVPAALDVTAWSLLDPTRLLSGTTVDVSSGGALIRLPMTPAAASYLDLRISLPDGTLSTRARVIRHDEPDLVAVAFDALPPEDAERLIAFALARGRALRGHALAFAGEPVEGGLLDLSASAATS